MLCAFVLGRLRCVLERHDRNFVFGAEQRHCFLDQRRVDIGWRCGAFDPNLQRRLATVVVEERHVADGRVLADGVVDRTQIQRAGAALELQAEADERA